MNITEHIGKFPAYLADGFFLEKGFLRKFNNGTDSSFVKGAEKNQKMPLRINNYAVLEQNIGKPIEKIGVEKIKIDNSAFMKQNLEKLNEKFENKNENNFEKKESFIEKKERKISAFINKSERKERKNSDFFIRKTEKSFIGKEDQQMKSDNEIEKKKSGVFQNENPKEVEEKKKIEQKSSENLEKIEKKIENFEKTENPPKNLEKIPKTFEKTQKSFEKIQEKASEKYEKVVEKLEKHSESFEIFDKSSENHEKTPQNKEDFERNNKKKSSEKLTKPIVVETYVVNFNDEENYFDDSFEEQSQKHKFSKEISQLNEIKEKPGEFFEKNKESNEIAQEIPKNIKKNKKKPQKELTKTQIITSKQQEKSLELENSQLSAQSPKKNRQINIEMSSFSGSPKKIYEYNVDFENSPEISQEIHQKKPQKLIVMNKSLNKSREISPLSLESPSKMSIKLVPLRELPKKTDSLQEMPRKQTKLVPVKGASSLERPITQEGNHRKKPGPLSEIPKGVLKFETEKFCNLNIPIKKTVKKVDLFHEFIDFTINLCFIRKLL